MVFIRFSGHCLLWPQPLTFRTQNLTSASLNPNASLTKIGCNYLHWFLRHGVHKVFGSLPAVTLTSDLSITKANQHIYEPKYICDQNWLKFPSLVFEIRRSQSFRHAQTQRLKNSLTHGRTHSRTNRPEYSMPWASFFQRWRGHKNAVTPLQYMKTSIIALDFIRIPFCAAYILNPPK